MKFLICILALSLTACGSAIVGVGDANGIDDGTLDTSTTAADDAPPEACAMRCNNLCRHCVAGCCVGGEVDAGAR